MTMDEIFKTMQDLIAEQFAIDTDEIGMDSSFVDDLGADSVDLVELVMAMEEEFDMGEANEDELAGLKTVGDAVNFVASTLTNGVPRILLARRTISVLPTPVGPRKRNDPIGRLGSFNPTRPLRTALATADTASSCPITRL